ncbi:hypothetical protein SDC9_120981 [bioreactor metagenome]|uniref:Uncharacterized protein n=1 Tax=bioreactor metagenome TaxID=1076179 RepID=A0A645CAN7_9ZZZZ|nr:hypothetical protein [Candidatus Pelethousia sp.]
MKSFVLRIGNNEYRISMPTAQVVAAEKQLGGASLLSVLDRIDSVAVQQVLLWAGLQKLNSGMTMDKVCGLMDAMSGGFEIDGTDYPDFSLECRVKLCSRIVEAAGFFTEAAAQELNGLMEEGA